MISGRALVIGASGFLGSHVVKALVDDGRPVRIMVRASSDTSATDHLNIERVVGAIDDVEALRSAMAGCDSVSEGVAPENSDSEADAPPPGPGPDSDSGSESQPQPDNGLGL